MVCSINKTEKYFILIVYQLIINNNNNAELMI